MPDTWSATVDANLCTGNCIRNGASTAGLFSLTTSIPSSLDKKALTTSELATYTNISTGSLGTASNQCPTKEEILGTF